MSGLSIEFTREEVQAMREVIPQGQVRADRIGLMTAETWQAAWTKIRDCNLASFGSDPD